tara:strand:- start:5480 stop:7075 length:1596 start_codon:yes stop_codon:yes gene_type:complete
MLIIKKNLFNIFLAIYFIIGSFASLNTGISFDEYHEEKNWKFHVKLTKNLTNHFFSNEELNRDFNKEYKINYLGYGIGFQIVSQPIQSFVSKIMSNNNVMNDYGNHLTSKHFVVFLFFFLSGIFLYLILIKIVDDKIFCSFTVFLYLLYPYLFGQSLFSPKDVPFMSIWVVCTYISFNFFDKIIDKGNVDYLNTLALSLMTAYLLSIRVAGILIFIQYFITFFIFLNLQKVNFLDFIVKFYPKIIMFIFSLIFFTLLFYPPFWLNPMLFFTAVDHMSNYFNDVCTNTLGSCMHPKDLPSTYIPIWLSVKLPLFIIIGIFLLPFTEKKIFVDKRKNIFFGTLLITSILLPLILILRKVHLYDELRQVMFLIPLLFLIGSISLYFLSKKFFYVVGILTACLFIIENIKINPYQYVWFNLPSRYLDLTNKFELEYQGISGREIASKISKFENNDLCVLANPMHTVKPYLVNSNFNCFDIWQKIDTDFKRPFLAVQHVRNLKKGKSYKCNSIYEDSFKLLFHKNKIITGKLLKCE